MAIYHNEAQDQVLRVLAEDKLSIGSYDACISSLSECVLKTKLIYTYKFMHEKLFSKFRIVPLIINGVSMFAVDRGGYVEKYCETKDDAIKECEKLNE